MAAALFDPVEEAVPGALSRLSQVLTVVDQVADEPLWPLSDDQVADLLGMVAWIRQRLSRVEVHAAAEGLGRGLPAQDGFTEANWILRAESALTQPPPPGHAAQLVRLVKAETNPALEHVAAALDLGELSPPRADALIRFHTDIAPIADPDSLTALFDILTEGARDSHLDPAQPDGGPERVRGLTDKELKAAITRTSRMVKPAATLDHDEDRARAGRSLYSRPGPCGTTDYRLRLDPEGSAVLDAAIAALSAPQPPDEHTPDLRPPARRRADALLDIVGRAAASPTGAPRTETTQVIITIPLTDLLSQVRGAGLTMTGQVLSPATVRKLACDAAIIPTILGNDGEVLDLAVPKRLFPPAMRKALWLRDKGCSYPGCTIPPQWCQAHHIQHWAHGGPTTVANGALLCARHHHHVHRRQLTATTTATGVTWHT